jgi:hypothetical protein
VSILLGPPYTRKRKRKNRSSEAVEAGISAKKEGTFLRRTQVARADENKNKRGRRTCTREKRWKIPVRQTVDFFFS